MNVSTKDIYKMQGFGSEYPSLNQRKEEIMSYIHH